MEGTVFHSWIRDSLLKKEGEAPQTTRDQISHTFGDVEERAWSGQTEVQILPSSKSDCCSEFVSLSLFSKLFKEEEAIQLGIL